MKLLKLYSLFFLSFVIANISGMEEPLTRENVIEKFEELKDLYEKNKSNLYDNNITLPYNRRCERIAKDLNGKDPNLQNIVRLIDGCTKIINSEIEKIRGDDLESRNRYTQYNMNRAGIAPAAATAPAAFNTSPKINIPKIVAYLCGTGICTGIGIYSYYKLSPEAWFRPISLGLSSVGGIACSYLTYIHCIHRK